MPASYLKTIAFGALSAALLLVGSALYPALSAFLLPFIPLPIAFATVRYHYLNGLGSGLVAALLVTAIAGSPVAVAYFVFAVLPACILGYFFNLRQNGFSFNKREPAPDNLQAWYPLGYIFLIAAVATPFFTLLHVLMASGSLETYNNSVRTIIEAFFRNELGLQPQAELVWPDGASMQPAINVFSTLVPVMTGIMGMGVHLFNLWFSASLSAHANRYSRPYPSLEDFYLPAGSGWLFVIGAVLAYFQDEIGLVGNTLIATTGACFALLGLSVLHAGIKGVRGRFFILLAVYFFVLFQGWPVVLVILLGVAEHFFSIRKRLSLPDTQQ
jgi:uncharacterized protein YybS (DUF2232 family)